jgi:hypothetical protein
VARIVVALVVLLLLCAPPAHAGRAYGVLTPGESLLTFELRGPRLVSAAVRLTVFCDDGESFSWAANFKLAKRPGRNDEYLVPLGGTRYRIVADYGRGQDLERWRGTLSVSRLDARKPRVHLVLHESDEISTCRAELTRLARREPGVLYTGGTDDDEPVWARILPEGVEWVAGYGVGCGARGFIEGFHTDLLPQASPTTFGRDGLIGGFDDDRAVEVHGVLGRAEAFGTQRVTGVDGDSPCDTKDRRWRAVTG